MTFIPMSILGACAHDNGSPAEPTGQPKPVEPSEPSVPHPGHGDIMTPDECQARGGVFKPSPGGEVACDEGQEKIGDVRFGIEGGICCR